MADYTFEQLKDMTVAQLREIAQGVQSDEVKGFLTMHKDHLLPALCKALGIDAHAHHVAKGAEKTKLKTTIHKLKAERDAAAKAHDKKKLAEIRHVIHVCKRKLRRMAV